MRTTTDRATAPAHMPDVDPVDEASDEGFPASDPPSWAPTHPGGPAEHPPDEPPREPTSLARARR